MVDIQNMTAFQTCASYTIVINVSGTFFGIFVSVYDWDFSKLYF